MKVFLATSFSAKVNYDTGEVFPEYKVWLEALIGQLEAAGHKVFCALRDEGYVINDKDPAAAFLFDMSQLAACEVLFVVLDGVISAGVQLEVGWAYAKEKKIIFAHLSDHKLPYVNDAMVRAKLAHEIALPLDIAELQKVLG